LITIPGHQKNSKTIHQDRSYNDATLQNQMDLTNMSLKHIVPLSDLKRQILMEKDYEPVDYGISGFFEDLMRDHEKTLTKQDLVENRRKMLVNKKKSLSPNMGKKLQFLEKNKGHTTREGNFMGNFHHGFGAGASNYQQQNENSDILAAASGKHQNHSKGKSKDQILSMKKMTNGANGENSSSAPKKFTRNNFFASQTIKPSARALAFTDRPKNSKNLGSPKTQKLYKEDINTRANVPGHQPSKSRNFRIKGDQSRDSISINKEPNNVSKGQTLRSNDHKLS
jgi:hypothetical protein